MYPQFQGQKNAAVAPERRGKGRGCRSAQRGKTDSAPFGPYMKKGKKRGESLLWYLSGEEKEKRGRCRVHRKRKELVYSVGGQQTFSFWRKGEEPSREDEIIEACFLGGGEKKRRSGPCGKGSVYNSAGSDVNTASRSGERKFRRKGGGNRLVPSVLFPPAECRGNRILHLHGEENAMARGSWTTTQEGSVGEEGKSGTLHGAGEGEKGEETGNRIEEEKRNDEPTHEEKRSIRCRKGDVKLIQRTKDRNYIAPGKEKRRIVSTSEGKERNSGKGNPPWEPAGHSAGGTG